MPGQQALDRLIAAYHGSGEALERSASSESDRLFNMKRAALEGVVAEVGPSDAASLLGISEERLVDELRQNPAAE